MGMARTQDIAVSCLFHILGQRGEVMSDEALSGGWRPAQSLKDFDVLLPSGGSSNFF